MRLFFQTLTFIRRQMWVKNNSQRHDKKLSSAGVITKLAVNFIIIRQKSVAIQLSIENDNQRNANTSFMQTISTIHYPFLIHQTI